MLPRGIVYPGTEAVGRPPYQGLPSRSRVFIVTSVSRPKASEKKSPRVSAAALPPLLVDWNSRQAASVTASTHLPIIGVVVCRASPGRREGGGFLTIFSAVLPSDLAAGLARPP